MYIFEKRGLSVVLTSLFLSVLPPGCPLLAPISPQCATAFSPEMFYLSIFSICFVSLSSPQTHPATENSSDSRCTPTVFDSELWDKEATREHMRSHAVFKLVEEIILMEEMQPSQSLKNSFITQIPTASTSTMGATTTTLASFKSADASLSPIAPCPARCLFLPRRRLPHPEAVGIWRQRKRNNSFTLNSSSTAAEGSGETLTINR
ncbi:unnamed protein product [Protopolystoma xenopodis]|uniref:Uncharacterized protein n=1 Tax=Protopolystoma xenopodis TaxID=117903 RepID=A0A448WHV2_9PLAT|nr:unnamed protein product [Protopolystoma xenopodis]